MNKFYYIFFFFFLFFSIIFSEPLSPLYITFGSSQIFFSHCSLIPYQYFFPSSCDLQFNSYENKIGFRYVSLFSFINNGFAFGYEKNDIGYHCISSGYGIKNENVSFGSRLNVILKKNEPILNLDISNSLHFKKYIDNLIVSVNNITLIHSENFNPDIIFDISGKIIEKPELNYNVSLISSLATDSIILSPVTAKLDLCGILGNNSSFIYSIGYQCDYSKKNLSNIFNFSLGSIVSILEKGIGLLFGYSVNLKDNVNTIQCNLSYNPFQFRDITPPFVSMNINCSENNNEGYYFTLKCNDYNGSGLKTWTLVISDSPSKNGEIIKIFSGGSSVPSTVFWNKKNSKGSFIDSINIFSRFVGIDNSNNIGYTPWVILNPCKE